MPNVKIRPTFFVSGQLKLPKLFLFAKCHDHEQNNMSDIFFSLVSLLLYSQILQNLYLSTYFIDQISIQ